MSRQIEPSEFWENVAFSVLLIIALWNLLQISYDYKWLVFLIITPIVFNTIFAFRETYQYNATEFTHRKVFLQLITLFILSPFILWGLKIISTYRYFEAYPADNLLSYKISVNIVDCDFGGIGNEWSYNYFINGEQVRTEDVFSVSSIKSVVVGAKFREDDPTYDDIGGASSTINLLSDKGIPRKTIYVAQEITVGETRGRGAGSSAHFHVQYTFKRVIPPEYGFYKTIKEGGNGLLIFSIICSLWQLISIAIIRKKIKETRAIKANIVKVEREKQEKERQEQIKRMNEMVAALAKKNEEERRIYSGRREASIKSLLGSDYEGAVRIPDDISFASDGETN